MTEKTSTRVISLDEIVSRLRLLHGDEEARRLVGEVLAEAGISDVSSPPDLLRLAERLITRGGFLEVVGRSLKVNAILRGAALPK